MQRAFRDEREEDRRDAWNRSVNAGRCVGPAGLIWSEPKQAEPVRLNRGAEAEVEALRNGDPIDIRSCRMRKGRGRIRAYWAAVGIVRFCLRFCVRVNDCVSSKLLETASPHPRRRFKSRRVIPCDCLEQAAHRACTARNRGTLRRLGLRSRFPSPTPHGNDTAPHATPRSDSQ
jgi:hypothetical protein